MNIAQGMNEPMDLSKPEVVMEALGYLATDMINRGIKTTADVNALYRVLNLAMRGRTFGPMAPSPSAPSTVVRQ